MLKNENNENSSTSNNKKNDIIIQKDNRTKKKIIEIIEHQFDLEIFLKYREIATIRKEIENAEATLHDLELSIKNESLAINLPEQAHFTRQTAAALYYGQSGSSLPTSTKRKLPKPVAQPSVVYGRRNDGVFVRLACPVCHRENFSNQLGFLNHCRISHSLEFGPYENVMIQCGTPIDESEVPDDHPIRQRPLQLPIIPAVSTPKKIIERPTIKEYEEDVDLELDQNGSRVKRIKMSPSPSPSLSPSPSILSSVAAVETHTLLNNKKEEKSTQSSVKNTDAQTSQNNDHIKHTLKQNKIEPEMIKDDDNNNTTTQNNKKDNLQKETISSSSSPISNNNNLSILPISSIPAIPPSTLASPSSPSSSTVYVSTATTTTTTTGSHLLNNSTPQSLASTPSSPIHLNNTKCTTTDSTLTSDIQIPALPPTSSLTPTSTPTNTEILQTSSNIPASMEDTNTAVITSAIEEKGSRFYIKRRIVVGNVSKYIPPEKRDPTLKNYTHKWMIYVMEQKQDMNQENKPFLTAVRFHLHPSYKPYDIVDVTDEPFRLTRLGWGEFPIRLQLYFVDKKRNKSLDIIHHLKLDYTHSGRQVLGSERCIDVELDRNTNFDDITGIPNTIKESTELTKEQLQLNAVKQKLTLLQSILKECLPEYPIICANQSIKLPYTCARNPRLFFTWSLAKRKALEWHRGHLLRLRVQQRCRDTNDDILLTASDALTTKDVLQWCRDNGHTPLPKETNEEKSSTLLANYSEHYYCKFCGISTHLTLQCPRKPDGWKKRSASLAEQQTLSNVNILFENLGWELLAYQHTNNMYIKGEQIEGKETEEGEEEIVDVDVEDRSIINNNTDYSTTSLVHQRMKEISSFFMESTIVNILSLNDANTLDWLWATINRLQLKTFLQNERLLSKMNDSLQKLSQQTVNAAPSTSLNQQLVVGTIITQITKIFLKKLINKASIIYKKEQEEDKNEVKILVPYHIHKAIKQIDSYDFLTNAYMGNITNDEEVPAKKE